MAFLKTDKKNSGTYLRIVESFRDSDGKNRHRSLYNLGKAEDYSPEALKSIGKILYSLGGGDPLELENKHLKELSRFYYGFPLVVKALLKSYLLDTFLERIGRNKSLSFNLLDCVSLLICERLHAPCSKLSNFNNQNNYFGLEHLELQHIYRTLDHLEQNQEPIKNLIYQKGRNLFNQKLDVVFYDVTTFYFDSSREDGFRQKGFGKDGKIGNTIIVFGLLIDQNKQPVGYEVYHGKQYEGHTFGQAIERLKDKYQIDKVICVADTGMMNTDNVTQTAGAGYEFIFGERLRNLSESILTEILDLSLYKTLKIESITDGQDIEIQYHTTGYKHKRLISTYSLRRAAKDKAEREEKLAKAREFLANPAVLEKKAKNFYLKKEDKGQYVLDEDKIQRSARFDGFMTIATNNSELAPGQIIEAYKQLYRIEQSFRSFKTFLETRPMFHWTKPRILGHLALCYISFTVLNHLQLKLRQQSTPQSENDIRRNLQQMQLSQVSQGGSQYYLRSKTSEGARQILKSLSLREILDLIPKESIGQYL